MCSRLVTFSPMSRGSVVRSRLTLQNAQKSSADQQRLVLGVKRAKGKCTGRVGKLVEHRHDRLFAIDGLRGVAAIAAAGFDLWPSLGGRHGQRFFSHGYLAADFFLCLSGFVLARTYGVALATGALSSRRFVATRAIRLLPLLTIVCALSFCARLTFVTCGFPFEDDTFEALLKSLPFGLVTLPQRLVGITPTSAFPLNPPAWFAFAATVVATLWATFLSRVRVSLILTAAGLGLILLLRGLTDANSLGFGATNVVTWWYPLVRAATSFLLGVVLWRHSRGLVDGIFYVEILATLLWAVLWLPVEPSWVFDLACILLVFPTIILFAASARSLATSPSVMLFLGKISFPLFAIHAFLLMLLIQSAKSNPDLLTPATMPMVLASWVACAWLVAKYVERPARAWFAQRFGI